MSFQVKFWGVRGSIACPSTGHVRVGGNTSCVEMRVGGERLIFDAGTGLRQLGLKLLGKNHAERATLLLSHTHWDHIEGFPFFLPIYRPSFTLRVLAGHLGEKGGVRDAIDKQMSNPFFPVPMAALKADLAMEDFRAGEALMLGEGIRVRTAPLNHPGGATGYRVEYRGKSVCYVTDTEHVPGKPDANVLGLIAGADLVIYDCTYTDREFPHKVGWGHSTWEEGMRLCLMANVRSLAIFHHDPSHDDRFMKKVEKRARRLWSKAFVAREGMRIAIL